MIAVSLDILVFVGGNGRRLMFFPVQRESETKSIIVLDSLITDLSFLPQSNSILATSSKDHSVCRIVESFNFSIYLIIPASFQLRFWNLTEGNEELIHQIDSTNPIEMLNFHPNVKQLMAIASGEILSLWDYENRIEVAGSLNS